MGVLTVVFLAARMLKRQSIREAVDFSVDDDETYVRQAGRLLLFWRRPD
jgi:hypothetical protein